MSSTERTFLTNQCIATNDYIAVRVGTGQRLFTLLLRPQFLALLQKVLSLIAFGVDSDGVRSATLKTVTKFERICLRFALYSTSKNQQLFNMFELKRPTKGTSCAYRF
jgi:hypothetical protein